jgi:Zn-dependent peptidase ImmA (M78 family)
MSIENEDYPVKAISDSDIEKTALSFRLRTNTLGILAPNIVNLIEKLIGPGLPLEGVRLIIESDQKMGKDLALSLVNEKILKIRSSVYDGALSGNPRDRFTIAHEIGHFALTHGGAPKHRVAAGNQKLNYIEASKSAERQANVFAAALLMPREQVRRFSSPTDIAAQMHVSLSAAKIRFEQIAPKTTPPDIISLIDDLKKSVEKSGYSRNHKSVLSNQQRANLAWEFAEPSTNQDPSEYRVVDNKWNIRRSKFESSTIGGWRLASNDTIIVWEDEFSR